MLFCTPSFPNHSVELDGSYETALELSQMPKLIPLCKINTQTCVGIKPGSPWHQHKE